MIDAFQDELLTMTDAAKVCPKVRGKRPSTVTMWRWATKGRRGVKLECVWVGRHILTTKTALNAFFNAVGNVQTVEQGLQAKPPRAASNNQREREIATARSRLIARGMLPKETVH